MSLTTDVIDRLAELGDTADQVADALIEKDITGVPEEPCACPVFNYLIAEGIPVTSVGDEDIELADGTVVDTPSVISAFIYGFDQGEFPELEASADLLEEVRS